MSERVFADEFYKGFFREGDFLAFIEEREENSDWEKVKSSELLLTDCRRTPCFIYAGGKIAGERKGVCI